MSIPRCRSPSWRCAGLSRLHLGQGKAALVTVDIPLERLRYWDTAKQQYVVEPGDYELLVGAASDDIRLRVPLKVAASN